MADRTVRTIFEAVTKGAQSNLQALGKEAGAAGKKADELTKDLKALDGLKVNPEVDVKIDAAERELADLKLSLADLKSMEASPEVDVQIGETEQRIREVRTDLQALHASKTEVKIDVALGNAQKRLQDLQAELGELRTMEATAEVRADITTAQKNLREVKAEIRELNGAKAQLNVTADTSGVKEAFDDIPDAGADAGDDAGENIVSGILGALQTIPIAGAVIGVGVAIAGGILLGIQQGLAIEAERDLFSARTGLDEETSARFGRAAGEAYANAWGDSVAANLETARIALEQGLIDADAVDEDVQRVIESLSGISEIMQEDIPSAARAAGQLIKTGLADTAEDAFDVLVAGYQAGANASQDLLDTFTEYSVFFKDLGVNAEEATGLLIQGLDAGAFNADKVADSLKELTIKVKELDATAGPALEQLGLDGQAMSAAFAEGGPAARDALDQILTALADVEDPAERARLAVALFGTQAEDMASSINSLSLDTAASELDDVGGAAGAAEKALQTMSDNTSSQMESARRNIEIAMDGIKGALAAAFADDIEGAAKWVQSNRAPLMEFFQDVINGAFEMGKSFIEFGATALDAVADVADAIAEILVFLPGFSLAEKKALNETTAGWRETAQTMRTEYVGALDGMQADANAWLAPEIMAARVNDATVVMTSDFDAFLEKVNTADGTVTINGETIPAEEALDVLVSNIDGSDGTVTINGDKVPADEVLDTLLALINASEEDVTIGGIPDPAIAELRALEQMIAQAEEDVTINGNDATGRAVLEALRQKVDRTRATIGVGADTSSANSTIQSFIFQKRTVYIDVVARGGQMVPGAHSGGWVKGLSAGGWVPGSDPGYDNVAWPLHSGGQVMTQPLAGGEYVVNSRDASYWAQALEAINNGYRPSGEGASLVGLRISGQLGLDGRLVGVIEAVDDFASNAPMRSRMSGVR